MVNSVPLKVAPAAQIATNDANPKVLLIVTLRALEFWNFFQSLLVKVQRVGYSGFPELIGGPLGLMAGVAVKLLAWPMRLLLRVSTLIVGAELDRRLMQTRHSVVESLQA